MNKKNTSWIKRIPHQYTTRFENLDRFKISLRECENKTQIKRAKQHLDLYVIKYIFSDNNINKIQAQEMLKLSLKEYLYNLNHSNTINMKIISKNVDDMQNKFTIVDLMNKEIEKRQKEYKLKQQQKEKIGVDVEIKVDTTLSGYKTIRNHLIRYNSDKDYSQITNDDIDDFKYFILDGNANIGGVIGYFKYLKAIFGRLVKSNKISHNPIIIPKKLSLEEEEKIIFTYQEITNILNNANCEDCIIFNTLLHTGMRLDELCSLKKKDIKNNNFNFFDSKDYFKKVVPIQITILDDIINKTSNLNDDDYLFYNSKKGKYRVQNVRTQVSKIVKKYSSGKTIHKTRTTFISYLNYHCEGFNDKDIKSITHKLSGIDDKYYVKIRNVNNLRTIINSISLEKLQEIEDLTT